jgi:hypothetical protein
LPPFGRAGAMCLKTSQLARLADNRQPWAMA